MLGIISDTHDNVVNIKKAVEVFKQKRVDFVVHLGDIIAPATVRFFEGLRMRFIPGNCDGDIELIKKKIKEINGEFLENGSELHIGTKNIMLFHGAPQEKLDELINSFDLRLGKHLKSADLTRLSGMIASSNAGEKNNLISALLFMITTDIKNRFRIIHIRRVLKKSYKLEKSDRKEILTHLKRKAALIRRKDLLAASHKLLHYWHVVHVPLAVVMFLIMFLHIGVHYLFRPGR